LGHSLAQGQGAPVQLYYPIELQPDNCSGTPTIYLIDSPVFTVGVRLFTGSPRNPQPVTTLTAIVYNTEIFNVDINGFVTSSTGVIC
jgi:hypothetical protein